MKNSPFSFQFLIEVEGYDPTKLNLAFEPYEYKLKLSSKILHFY